MIIKNPSPNEIIEFYNSLTTEKKTFRITSEDIQKSTNIVSFNENGAIIGLAGIRKVKYLNVLYIVVNRNHHSKGIARSLMEALINESRRNGVRYIILSVVNSNYKAKNLFKQFNFKPFFRRNDLTYMIRL